jgi:hypothetical protein
MFHFFIFLILLHFIYFKCYIQVEFLRYMKPEVIRYSINRYVVQGVPSTHSFIVVSALFSILLIFILCVDQQFGVISLFFFATVVWGFLFLQILWFIQKEKSLMRAFQYLVAL